MKMCGLETSEKQNQHNSLVQNIVSIGNKTHSKTNDNIRQHKRMSNKIKEFLIYGLFMKRFFFSQPYAIGC